VTACAACEASLVCCTRPYCLQKHHVIRHRQPFSVLRQRYSNPCRSPERIRLLRSVRIRSATSLQPWELFIEPNDGTDSNKGRHNTRAQQAARHRELLAASIAFWSPLHLGPATFRPFLHAIEAVTCTLAQLTAIAVVPRRPLLPPMLSVPTCFEPVQYSVINAQPPDPSMQGSNNCAGHADLEAARIARRPRPGEHCRDTRGPFSLILLVVKRGSTSTRRHAAPLPISAASAESQVWSC